MAKYSERVMKNVRENMGLEPNDTSQDKFIEALGRHEVLDRFLTWEGIIGYTNKIEDAISDIYNVNLIN